MELMSRVFGDILKRDPRGLQGKYEESEFPKGSKNPNNRVLGPNCFHVNGISLELQYVCS